MKVGVLCVIGWTIIIFSGLVIANGLLEDCKSFTSSTSIAMKCARADGFYDLEARGINFSYVASQCEVDSAAYVEGTFELISQTHGITIPLIDTSHSECRLIENATDGCSTMLLPFTLENGTIKVCGLACDGHGRCHNVTMTLAEEGEEPHCTLAEILQGSNTEHYTNSSGSVLKTTNVVMPGAVITTVTLLLIPYIT